MSGNDSLKIEPYTPWEKLSAQVVRFGTRSSCSLALAFVCLSLLVISYVPHAEPRIESESFSISAFNGELSFWHWHSVSAAPAESDPVRGFALLGFGYHEQPNHSHFGGYVTSLYVPLWFLIAGFAVAPCLRYRVLFRRMRTARLHAEGLCTSCGYDLRASNGVCPECGSQPVETLEQEMKPLEYRSHINADSRPPLWLVSIAVAAAILSSIGWISVLSVQDRTVFDTLCFVLWLVSPPFTVAGSLGCILCLSTDGTHRKLAWFALVLCALAVISFFGELFYSMNHQHGSWI